MPPLRIPDNLQTKYSNMARISHTPSEIVLDFAQMLPGVHPEIVSRVLMSPVAAKLFVQALTENVARYEAMFGPIKLPIGASDLATTLFRNVQPPTPGEPPHLEESPKEESPKEESPKDEPTLEDEPPGDDTPPSPSPAPSEGGA
jgi:outer membrane biosynthesis protein TonB